jgi:hypothetical protein
MLIYKGARLIAAGRQRPNGPVPEAPQPDDCLKLSMFINYEPTGR